MGQRVALDAASAIDVLLTKGHIELTRANSNAVLSTVALLLHEEEKLIQAPEWCAVLFDVVANRLSKSNDGDAAFVVERITHRSVVIVCSVKNKNTPEIAVPWVSVEFSIKD